MRWYKVALRLAEKSKHHKYKMAAVVFQGGRILAGAANGEHAGRHAELRALARDVDFAGASIVIARLGGRGTSRPCQACFMLIRNVGIKRMYFIDEQGELSSKNVKTEHKQDYRDYGQERWLSLERE